MGHARGCEGVQGLLHRGAGWPPMPVVGAVLGVVGPEVEGWGRGREERSVAWRHATIQPGRHATGWGWPDLGVTSRGSGLTEWEVISPSGDGTWKRWEHLICIICLIVRVGRNRENENEIRPPRGAHGG